MKNINVSNDLIPVGKSKTSLAKWLKTIQNSGHALIITRHGKPGGVLLSLSEYNARINAFNLLSQTLTAYDPIATSTSLFAFNAGMHPKKVITANYANLHALILLNLSLFKFA